MRRRATRGALRESRSTRTRRPGSAWQDGRRAYLGCFAAFRSCDRVPSHERRRVFYRVCHDLTATQPDVGLSLHFRDERTRRVTPGLITGQSGRSYLAQDGDRRLGPGGGRH